MTVGRSICAAQLYDKITNIGKITKYKLPKSLYASILQKQTNYSLA